MYELPAQVALVPKGILLTKKSTETPFSLQAPLTLKVDTEAALIQLNPLPGVLLSEAMVTTGAVTSMPAPWLFKVRFSRDGSENALKELKVGFDKEMGKSTTIPVPILQLVPV